MAVADNRSCSNELTLSGFNCCCLTVDEQKYDLFGIVCSDSESDNEWELLESYLTQTTFVNSSSQSMARTKQTWLEKQQGGHQVDLPEENHWRGSVLQLPVHKVIYWKVTLNWKRQRTCML